MPFKENEREYRSFQSYELVSANEENKETKSVNGYASTFEEYVLRNRDGQIWTERLDQHAFDNTDTSDVVFLKDHTGTVYARNRNGTLNISVDENGLKVSADLSKTTSARQMYEEIEAGLYDQMSFGFVVNGQHFEHEERDGQHIIHRIIDSVAKIFDVSAVSFPANPTTEISISTRDAFNGEIEQFEAERLRVEEEQRKLLKKKLELKLKLGGLEK